MFAVLGYKNHYCDLAPGDPTDGGVSFWDAIPLPGKPVTTHGSAPLEFGDVFQLLCTNGTGIGQRNAFQVVELDGGWMQLPTLLPWDAPDGYRAYLSCHGGRVGIRHVPRDAPGPDDTFQLVSLTDDDSVFAIRTSQNTFLTTERDGNGSPLACNRTEIGEWERFTFLPVPDELVPPEEAPVNIGEQLRTGVGEAQTRTVAGVATQSDVASQAVHGLDESGLRDKLFRPGP